MPKVIPVADELSKPFWDAVNEKRLVLQNCAACDKLQYPPQQTCQVCGSAEKLEWKEANGKGHISTYIVIEDGRLNRGMSISGDSDFAPVFPDPQPILISPPLILVLRSHCSPF